MFSSAKQWLESMSGSNYEDFETFWQRCESMHLIEGYPTKFYTEVLSRYQKQERVSNLAPQEEEPSPPNSKIRFVFTSDTHNQTDRCSFQIPDGDVLLHAGDFTQVGRMEEVEHFADWLDSLPHPIKIVIAGNHELSFDPKTNKGPDKVRVAAIERLHKSCTYLEDSSAIVYGNKIFGSPWQPEFGGWAYNLRRIGECKAKWLEIPDDTDILMTHGPPIGHGDRCRNGIRAGCVDLLREIQLRVKPAYHLFGHIHEDPGGTTDGQTIFLNGSMCTLRYRAEQYPLVFDLDKKSGEMVLESAPAVWALKDPRDEEEGNVIFR